MTEIVKKYTAQIKYDKKMRAENEEYRQKKNLQTRTRNKYRYETDMEYAEKQREKARERSKMLRDFYKLHTNKIV